MTILCDIEIKQRCNGFGPMIQPFLDHLVRVEPEYPEIGMIPKKVISYGLSSHGYDVRLADKFKIFSNVSRNGQALLVDPLQIDEDCFVPHEGPHCIIPPNSYVLGHTIEVFDIPRVILAICVGKSTYARSGIHINVTPIEPGFRGQVVIEISNGTPLPVKVYANQGIAQFLFLRGRECETSYADRDGKYQDQRGIVLPRG